MEKSELRLRSHSVDSKEKVIEVWHEGAFIGAVYGSDGPGVRVISKHSMDVVRGGLGEFIETIEIRIETNKKGN